MEICRMLDGTFVASFSCGDGTEVKTMLSFSEAMDWLRSFGRLEKQPFSPNKVEFKQEVRVYETHVDPEGRHCLGLPPYIKVVPWDGKDSGCRTTATKVVGVTTQENTNRCNLPPMGWRCSRPKGHDGPCAAYSIDPSE